MVADALKEIIEPHMGTVMSDTCIRAAALTIGKTYDSLKPGDLSLLKPRIRQSLLLVTSLNITDTVMTEIDYISNQF